MTTYGTSRPAGTVLAALDIDGTLAVPGTTDISLAVSETVAKVLHGGHLVVLSSGRSLVGVLPVARKLGLREGWVVASNGAVTARLDPQSRAGYHLDGVRSFDPGPVVRRARVGFPGARVATEVIGRGYRVTHVFGARELSGEQTICDVTTAIDRRTTRLVLSAPGISVLAGTLSATGMTVLASGSDWLDVTAPGLSKATALENVRTQLGVRPEDTIAVGDGLNDLEMLAWAARGVAMGNAPVLVQEAADEVTGTLEEDGAATVLRSLLSEPVPAGR